MSVEVDFEEVTEVKITRPSKFAVVFLNDDVTPVDLVVELLVKLFNHTIESAGKLALEIHNEGSGVAGVYSFEIAEQKTIEATTIIRNQGFPLQVKVEEV